MQGLLDWATIKQNYPDTWVMIGYPETEKSKSLEEALGEVLYFDADKKKFIKYSGKHIESYKAKQTHSFYSPRFTGESELKKRIVLNKTFSKAGNF